jgi:hypothetical protein
MRDVFAILIAVTFLFAAGLPAGAQTGERVIDALTDLLRRDQQLRGHVVAVHSDDVVVRGNDGRTYTISAGGLDPQRLADTLRPGQPVEVKLGQAGDGPVAASIEADATGRPQSFRTVSGSVESVAPDRIEFRTTEGFVIPLDLKQIVGHKPSVSPGESATLTYDVSGQNPLTALWIERGTAATGSASPRTLESPAGTGQEH